MGYRLQGLGGNAMTYRGHIKDGLVVLDDPIALPDGTTVTIVVRPVDSVACPSTDRKDTLSESLLRFAGAVQGLPSDLARNHDHYLYGIPKR